jgi:hypothetical protein
MKGRKTQPLPPIRVRHEPPTLAEAIVAAQSLTGDVDQQVAIAAGLMGIPEEEVRPAVMQAPRPRWDQGPGSRVVSGAQRRPVVVVERRGGRLDRPRSGDGIRRF